MKDIEVSKDKCNCCSKPIKDIKKLTQCDFCACFGCGDCIYKQFPFPLINKSSKEAEEQEYGMICLVCETKLHINTVTSDILYKMIKIEKRSARKEREISAVIKVKEEV